MNTVNGRIEWQRTRWYAGQEGSDTPLDQLLDAAESTVSVGLRELCCRLGTDGRSFARSAKNLECAAQIKMSEEIFRQLVESEGKAVLKASAQEQLELDWSASACKTQTPQGQEVSRVYATSDGVLVPVTTQAEKEKRRGMVRKRRREKRAARGVRRRRLGTVKKGADQRYKQFFVTEFYSQDHKRRLVGVTRGDHRKLGRLLAREAGRVRLRGAQERFGLVDGAVCLRRHMEDLPLEEIGLDFWHGSEHVHAGARGTFGEKSQEAQQWAQDVLHTLRHEGYDEFWEKLTQWRCGLRGGKRACADGLLHYVAERKDMMQYVQYEQRGWHIGTGPVESMCKVTTGRVKGAGMRWDTDNAEAMMALEALHQSDLWDKYWLTRLRHASYVPPG